VLPNAIWVSGSFPFPFGDPAQQDRLVRLSDFLGTVQAVSNANMAVYPVDVHGLIISILAKRELSRRPF
jgi:hypothetical protein